ncbi:MAG: hypothetical protein HY005_00670 [Candidatus Staskawiczbacteria bacterium]|nr:hypothetical protein [Candidatus Staskawiczbacteria bacterium]
MKQEKGTLLEAIFTGSIFPSFLIFDFFMFSRGEEFLRIFYNLYASFGYWNILLIPLTIFLIGLGILASIRITVGYMF